MKKVYGFMLAFVIEYHWWLIMRYRRRGNHMIESGMALSSPALIKLSRRITRHGMRAFRFQSKYENEVLS